ncbi:MAG: hypothetical protein HC944_06555 [Nanoarchaeota archaeon]|nr:hypothetical protein [Nanoarchaeota archaeon]
MGKGGDTILIHTVLSLRSLEQEVGIMAKNCYEQGHDSLSTPEIDYLIKMTKHVIAKLRAQLMEESQ